MPLLAGAVTFSRFRVERPKQDPSETKRWVSRSLKSGAFEPLVPGQGEEDRATGFVEVEDHDATSFGAGDVYRGDHLLFGFRVDAIKVPSAQVKAEMGRWAAGFEAEHRRPPARREKAQARDAVRDMLRKRTPPTSKVHDVSFDLATNTLQIWAASRGVVDEVVEAIEKGFGVKLEARVPSAIAARSGIDPERFGPTPDLVGMDVPAAEATDDAA